jgi:hypothetical protein
MNNCKINEVEDNFTIMVVNCRSICNKLDKFRTVLETYTPDVAVAVETWLDDEYTTNEISMNGYTLFRKDRNKHGGGVMIVVKDELKSKFLWNDEKAEMVCINLRLKHNNLKIIGVYRPPNDQNNTLERLEEHLCASGFDGRLIIAGDLNMPGVRWTTGGNGKGKGLLQIAATEISNRGLVQTVREGTRETSTGTNNVLDVILIKPEEMWIDTEIIPGISDHKIPLVKLAINSIREHKKNVRKLWMFKKTKKNELQKEFDDRYAQWDKDTQDNGINTCGKNLLQLLMT